MTDKPDNAEVVRRAVGTRPLADGLGRVLSISRVYDTDIDDLWEACTDPARLRRWFLPVTGELRLGGRYHLEGNASGTVERCDPPNGFSATWEYDGTSWIDVALTTESEGRTRFDLVHIAPETEHWEQYGPGAAGIGWDISLLRLAVHLSGSEVEPEEEWAATEGGRRFMLEAGDSWCEADVVAGTDPAVAEAAAERTKAAYAGS
ncbi:polyketide cyclase [Prauserella marina]|uniref:Uncharacterized conserved protein YndB, AHSA1/START domain n=1 Tax=Prauserella marina TaxID=530584 RepID=A0A222VWI3_9PSEU|nr:SRPBCC family protein [Prauserella marina]ASR38277.1 polyketide cyclase [Prauserella marina]PWV78522.1 uncharacterized protein YndB with AHSA1/START domain [Prauserella marina]SDC87868.1 Uncharacterized conserved protein YndB, AHSA1/START domain [Prauserella marina]